MLTDFGNLGGGGGQGATSYSELTGKPKINGVTINGNLTGEQLGLVSAEEGKVLSDNNYTNTDKNKVANLPANTNAELAEKANKDGYYEQMGVGVADNLAGKGDGVPAEFTRRTTGGTASVADGVATIKAIKGKTLVWNQLCENGNFATLPIKGQLGYDWNVTNFIISKEGTQLKLDFQASGGHFSQKIPVIVGHKYLQIYRGEEGENGNNIVVSPVSNLGNYTNQGRLENGKSIILEATAGMTFIAMRFYSLAAGTLLMDSFQMIDLTQMFGAGNEPSTPADFEALFPAAYYAYNAGTPISFNGEGIVTDGFNQWDEEWEVGGYAFAKGIPSDQTDRIRSKKENYIPIFPTQTYYVKTPNSAYVFFYDAEKNYINYAVYSNQTFVPPTNAAYIRFFIVSAYGTTYNHDICINLSWSGIRNGEYEPHWQETRNLPNQDAFKVQYTGADGQTHYAEGVKSAGAAYDEQTPTKDTKRVGVVDLGSLNVTYSSGTYSNFIVENFCDNYHSRKYASEENPNFIVQGYSIYSRTAAPSSGNNIWVDNNTTGRLRILNTQYTTAAEFKAAMAGVLLFYELAEPVETEYAEPRNFSYKVSDFGTETLIPEGVDAAGVPKSAPFNGSIVYGFNAVDTLRNLPKDYISKASMDSILSALVSAGVIASYTLTYDAVSGKYNCTITPNA